MKAELTAIQKQKEEVDKKKLINSDGLQVYLEQSTIVEDVGKYKELLDRVSLAQTSVQRRLEEHDLVLYSAKQALEKAKTLKPDETEELRAALYSLKSKVFTFYREWFNPNDPWAKIPLDKPGFVAHVSKDNTQADLLGFIERSKEIETQRLKALTELKDELPSVIKVLQTRNVDIIDELSTVASEMAIRKWLWAYILLIGGLCLSILVATRVFSEALRMELFESGQLIQFVTVTVILVTIMTLALGGILKEQAIGTLLGGIGGYVLSQGVGLAARRKLSAEPIYGLPCQGAHPGTEKNS